VERKYNKKLLLLILQRNYLNILAAYQLDVLAVSEFSSQNSYLGHPMAVNRAFASLAETKYESNSDFHTFFLASSKSFDFSVLRPGR
jgi:hypothetical protein